MLQRLDRILCWVEEVFIATLLITASAILFTNVVARYLFNAGFVWAEELVRYEIIWMVFIGGSVAVRKGIHIGVEAVVLALPMGGARVLRVAVSLICIAFCLVLMIYGAQLAEQTQAFGQKTSAMQAPVWVIQLAIPLGAGLMCLRFSQGLWNEIFGDHRRAETEIIS